MQFIHYYPKENTFICPPKELHRHHTDKGICGRKAHCMELHQRICAAAVQRKRIGIAAFHDYADLPETIDPLIVPRLFGAGFFVCRQRPERRTASTASSSIS